MDSLEVPQPLARPGIQSKQGVREKIVTHPIRSIKIKHRRTGRNIDDAPLLIERHASPVVCRPCGFPRIGGPGGVTKFARVWDGVESPAQTACTNIEGANIAGRRWIRLRVSAANNDQILVND